MEKEVYEKEIEFFRDCEAVQIDYVKELLQKILIAISHFEKNVEGEQVPFHLFPIIMILEQLIKPIERMNQCWEIFVESSSEKKLKELLDSFRVRQQHLPFFSYIKNTKTEIPVISNSISTKKNRGFLHISETPGVSSIVAEYSQQIQQLVKQHRENFNIRTQ